ncbi:CBS domain-containing protein [Desulfovibrio sulfodismutans]|uniref:histidine kinase n=1 Tax=Desulfolutivibrio sulfodismutans TaxID=63561 RepID=A0A7K3NP67_9BACT|nr:CBS domain-containing protein [Desulfolutivibrio sulfodismutans]NDY57917.1 CBS domain-containing protein [Desulfolutivibrio sulfodismutans]
MFRKRLGEIHSRDLVAVAPRTTVGEVAGLMRERALSCLPVLDDGRPVGIVTERGLLWAVAVDTGVGRADVSTIMSSPVLTATPDMTAHEAYSLLQKNRLRHLVVVSADGAACGVVSQSDLVEHLGYEYFVELRRLSRIMVREVVTAAPATPLAEALGLMAEKSISCLLAVEDGRPVGIFTERDAAAVILAGEAAGAMSLGHAMRTPVLTVAADIPVHEGLSLMRRNGIRRLVMVDGEGRLVGLVTQSDVVNAMEWEYIGVLKEIIREKEESYRNIFVSAMEGIFCTGMDGRILEANPAMARMLGYDSPEELMDSVRDIGTQLYTQTGRRGEILAILSQGEGPYTFEAQFRRRDGDLAWVSCTAKLFRDFQGRAARVEGICLDITGRKNAELALARSEARYRSIVEDQTELICRYRPDGRLSFVNEAYVRYFGKDRRDLIGENFIPHIPDADMVVITRGIASISMANPVVDFEHRIVMPGGIMRWQRWTHRGVFDLAGNVVEYQAVGNDVTERKLAEEALEHARDELEARVAARTAELAAANASLRQEIEARAKAQERLKENAIFLETILDAIQDGISVLDTDLNVIKVNATMQAMYESGSPLVGRACHEAFRGRATPCPSCPSVRAMADGRMHSEAVSREIDEGGPPGFIELFSYPFRDGLGRIKGVVEFVRDITERKRLERELLRAMHQSDAANQAKSRFLANMSHEIRTPLNAVLGYIQLVLHEELSPKARQRLGVAEESAQTLLSVINDILDYSKIEAGKLDIREVSVDLREISASLARQQEVLAKNKGLTLSCRVAPDVPRRVFADPMRLKQILLNLVGNAIKYTERGGVEVEVSRAGHRGLSTSRVGGETATLVFSVSDTGIGIPEDSREAVFDSFTQVDSGLTKKYAGTGLGLAICKKIAGLLGGDLSFDSQVGQGSTFRFQVALRVDSRDIPDVQAVRPDLEACAAIGGERPLRVLLVEDNRINRMFAEDLLSSHGHAVATAEDGRQALERLCRESFDVVLMDIQMPVMDGLTATRAIRAGHGGIDPAVAVIGLSAYALDRERERFLDAGLDGYITKPVNIESFFQAVSRITRGRGRVADMPLTAGAVPRPAASVASVASGASAAPQVEEPVDRAGLAAQYGKKTDLLRLLAGEFEKAAPTCLSDMEAALRDNDLDTFARLAHTLRGNAAMFGAGPLRHDAALAEEAAVRGDRAQTTQLAPLLAAGVRRTLAALDAFLTAQTQETVPSGTRIDQG